MVRFLMPDRRARHADARPHVHSQDKAAAGGAAEAKEALKWLVTMGLEPEAVAHRVAAIMTGKKVASHAAGIDAQLLAMAALRCVFAMPDDMAHIKAQVAENAKIEVAQKLSVVADVAHALGPAALMKILPTQHDLHRHVAVLLPDYDAQYTYTQGDASSSLKGPGGLKWKTRRTPDEDNDPRFPDFW
jgi:hypothetical protein